MDRPRRTTRQPARLIDIVTSSPPTTTRSKRKTTQDAPIDTAEQLHTLLTSPKSDLTTMEISDLINTASWNMLSSDSQNMLKTLLPSTSFIGFNAVIGADHPSAVDSGAMAESTPSAIEVVDTAVFTDSHFLAAAHTLQDHIYSGWMSKSHAQKVAKYEEGIRNGTMAAPWKDEVWERNNGGPRPVTMPTNNGTVSSSDRAGEAAEIKLVTLAQAGVLQVGDIIVLKRNFSALDILIEKDAIIQSIHPKTHTLTVLLEPGTSTHLPAPLLSPHPSPPTGLTQEAVITSPTQLETALLDNDGRVERGKRPNGNAWKSMTVWRWRGTAPWEDVGGGRWGRENHGTLFYLRGTYYHER
ncbi:hypothetical protein E4T56_gene11881 [Termitomyces sp. T112]|nr:hypothetical protein C0989_011544 [Termitomyces sp. Mn162]KAG5719139.1 hypothetical protein E4T56_gene11881 [Termitomyces sp. T112]